MQHRMLPGGLCIWYGVCWIIVGQDSLDLMGNGVQVFYGLN
jgi:hypothetical protein